MRRLGRRGGGCGTRAANKGRSVHRMKYKILEREERAHVDDACVPFIIICFSSLGTFVPDFLYVCKSNSPSRTGYRRRRAPRCRLQPAAIISAPMPPHEVKAGPDAALGAYFERDSVIVGNSSFHEHGLTASESMRKRTKEAISRGKGFLVIDPRTTKWLQLWDMVMIVALFFTATVTPFEVAFLEEDTDLSDGANKLWIVNRVVDGLFFIDVLIIRNTMVERDLAVGGTWIGHRSEIIGRYVSSGWLFVDIFSIFPFWVFGLGLGATGAESTSDATGQLTSLRLVKLLRMLKLARVMKASSHFKPHFQSLLMDRLEMTYAVLNVISLMISLVLYTHLQACFWALFSSFTADPAVPNKPTWTSTFNQTHFATFGTPAQPWDYYMSSLYWSAMTVTSIGYGEMLPVNSEERLVCSVMMIMSGMLWTYVLSTASGIAATLNPNQVMFQNTMDQLSYFMRERHLPRPMRRMLRDFFEKARQVREVNDDSSLLEAMSPHLQGTVAYVANKAWLEKIWYLGMMEGNLGGDENDTRDYRDFVAMLAKSLTVRAYVTEERPALGQLYVLRRGMCVKNWRFLRAGHVFGDDMIIDSLRLMDHCQAVALTYCEAFSLSREALDSAASGFLSAQRGIERAARRMLLQRALLLRCCEIAGRRPRSFIPQKYASGYFFVSSQMSSEQKVNVLHAALIDDGQLNMKASSSSLAAALTASGAHAKKPKRLTSMLRMGHDPHEDDEQGASVRGSTSARGGRAGSRRAGPTASPSGASLAALEARVEALAASQAEQHATVVAKLEEIRSASRLRAERRHAKSAAGRLGARAAASGDDDPAPRSAMALKSTPSTAALDA